MNGPFGGVIRESRSSTAKRDWPWFVFAAILLTGLLAYGTYVERRENTAHLNLLKTWGHQRLALIGSRMEELVDSTEVMAHGIEAAIILQPDISQSQFEDVAGRFLRAESRLRHLALAKDLVISHIHPMEGNAAALGLDYRNIPEQRMVALAARDSGLYTVAGPVRLVQDGNAIIGRLPVFLPGAGRDGSFWGLISIVIDTDTLYRESGLLDLPPTWDVGLRKANRLGGGQKPFFGNATAFGGEPVIVDVQLPSATWQVSVVPVGGWQTMLPNPWPRRILLGALALLCVTGMAALYRWLQERNRSETKISQLQAMLDAAINQTVAGIVIIDFPEKTVRMINAEAIRIFAQGGIEIDQGSTLEDMEGLQRVDLARMAPEPAALSLVLNSGKPIINHQTIIPSADGQSLTLLVNAGPIHDPQGRLVGGISILSDITELQKARTDQKQIETRLFDAIHSIDSGVALWDQEDRLRLFNEGLAKAHDHIRDDIHTGMTFREFLTLAINLPQDGKDRQDLDRYIRRRVEEHRQLKGSQTREWRVGDRWLSISERRTREGWIAGLYVDLTDRIETERHLRRTQEKAERASKAKTVFLANMTHELRTPLNSIILTSEMMASQLFGPLSPQYKEYADIIHGSGKHLLALISDILDMAKIESGEMNLEPERVDITDIIEECEAIIAPRANQAGLKIVRKINVPLIVQADRLRLKQSLLNLMSNAVKFSQQGNIILATSRNDKGAAIIDVIDNGIGISEKDIRVALQLFGQVEGSYQARKFEGSGLGLPITRQLMELHGGSLELISELGKGTTARLILPSACVITNRSGDDQK